MKLHPHGYVTLLSVLVVGAIGTAVVTTLLLLGLSSSRTSFSYEQQEQAQGLADACTEDALQEIRDNTSYVGSGGFSAGQGSCTFTVTSQGGENRTIEATGTVDTVVRKVEVVISAINPTITISSWQNVADF